MAEPSHSLLFLLLSTLLGSLLLDGLLSLRLGDLHAGVTLSRSFLDLGLGSSVTTTELIDDLVELGLLVKHLVDVALLVKAGLLKHGNILAKRTNAVLEVDEIKSEVGEDGELRVVLTLANKHEVLVVSAVNSEVFEDLHETDLVAVRQVAKVFEEGLLLLIIFEIITVLLDSLLDHVLAESTGLLIGNKAISLGLESQGAHGSVSSVRREQVRKVLLKSGISGLCSLKEARVDAAHLALVLLERVTVLSVLVLEDLLLNDVIVVLVAIGDSGVVDEVVECGVKLASASDGDLIELLVDEVVLRVHLEIGLEVVAVLLLFLGQVAKEVSVVLGPSDARSLDHTPLTTLVVDRVSESTSVVLLDLVEDAVELED